MAKTIRAKNEYQQNIVKMLNSLAGRYSRWTVWQDFITMAAVAICNSVPHPHREVREKLYMQCAEKYTAAELATFAKMLAGITMGIEANPQQIFLANYLWRSTWGMNGAGSFLHLTAYAV